MLGKTIAINNVDVLAANIDAVVVDEAFLHRICLFVFLCAIIPVVDIAVVLVVVVFIAVVAVVVVDVVTFVLRVAVAV